MDPSRPKRFLLCPCEPTIQGGNPRSLDVVGGTNHHARHVDVIDELGISIRAVIHVEITIPSQQDDLAADPVAQQSPNLIIRSRVGSAGVTANRYKGLR